MKHRPMKKTDLITISMEYFTKLDAQLEAIQALLEKKDHQTAHILASTGRDMAMEAHNTFDVELEKLKK